MKRSVNCTVVFGHSVVTELRLGETIELRTLSLLYNEIYVKIYGSLGNLMNPKVNRLAPLVGGIE